MIVLYERGCAGFPFPPRPPKGGGFRCTVRVVATLLKGPRKSGCAGPARFARHIIIGITSTSTTYNIWYYYLWAVEDSQSARRG